MLNSHANFVLTREELILAFKIEKYLYQHDTAHEGDTVILI